MLRRMGHRGKAGCAERVLVRFGKGFSKTAWRESRKACCLYFIQILKS
jgi:hypothetical protein